MSRKMSSSGYWFFRVLAPCSTMKSILGTLFYEGTFFFFAPAESELRGQYGVKREGKMPYRNLGVRISNLFKRYL